MSRAPREYSESGFYHVTVRANGKQILFEDDADCHAFLGMVAESLEPRFVTLLAWCLMSNHVHLIVDDPEGRLSEAMGVLLTKYAKRFNSLTGHVGNVFEARFGSFPIENENYLLYAVRYVHNNPVRAGMCARPADYRWSSYHEYVSGTGISNTAIVIDMLDGVAGFEAFMNEEDTSGYRPGKGRRLTTEEALEIARQVLGGIEPHDVGGLDKPRRDELLRCLRRAGLSVRQIERLTGVGKNTISRVTSE